MSFNGPLGDFPPSVVWAWGAGPLAAYALAMAMVTRSSGAALPRATRVRAVAAAVVVGAACGWVVQQTSLFGSLLHFFQGTLVLGTLLALTGVGLIGLLGIPAASLAVAYQLSKRRRGWFAVTLGSCALVAWWVQTLVGLGLTQTTPP